MPSHRGNGSAHLGASTQSMLPVEESEGYVCVTSGKIPPWSGSTVKQAAEPRSGVAISMPKVHLDCRVCACPISC